MFVYLIVATQAFPQVLKIIFFYWYSTLFITSALCTLCIHLPELNQTPPTHTNTHFCLCPHCIIHVTLHEELYQQKPGMLRRLEQGTHDSLSSCIIVRDLFALRNKKYLNYMSHNLGWASIISRFRIEEFMLRSQADFIEFIPVYRDTDRVFSFLLVPRRVCDGPRKLGLKPSVAT